MMGATRLSTPVTCEVCGKMVSRKADLPRHMRTHATNKKELMHACPYEGCNYKALQRSNVATHIRTHTGERPNKCPTTGCPYTTSDPGSLTRHRKAAHGYEPKAHALSHPSTCARKATRQQRRAAPYSTSPSPLSSSSSASSPSSPDSFSDILDLPLPEIEKMLEMCPTFPLVSDFAPIETVKSALPAYNSGLIPEFSTFTDPFLAPIDEEELFLPFNSQLLPSPTVSYAAESAQPLPPLDMLGFGQEPLYDTTFSVSTSSPIPDVTFAYSLLPSKDLLSVSPAFTPSPPLTTGDYVAPMDVNSAILDNFLEQLSQWQIENGCAPAPSPSPFLSSASQACFDDMPCGYSPSPGFPSLVVPAMGGGVFPQAINPSRFHTIPSGMNEFFTNGILTC